MPEARADFRSGQICALLANIHRTDRDRVFSADEFMPGLDSPAEPIEEEEAEPEPIDIEAHSKALMKMLGRKE